MISSQQEIQRLNRPTNDFPYEGHLVELVASCNDNATEVLEKCKEVLKTILGSELSLDDSIEDWKDVLPAWFVNVCSPEISREEAERILSKPGGEKRLSQNWSASGFIFWFRPENRTWYWWNDEVKDSNTLTVQVLVYEFPFAWGALDWLLKASGATEVSAIE